jgi:methanogenic corrinoid protein MtbC1
MAGREEVLKKLEQGVVNFDEDASKAAAEEALEAGLSPFEAMSKGLCEGMKRVGEMWNRMELFLPEVLAAASAFYAGLNVLKPKMAESDTKEFFATAVFGTIFGDIHSVGKDVAMPVFQGEGFNCIDLGVDCPPEKYIEAIKKYKPQMVGLGTYMSETFFHVTDTVEAIKKAGLRDKVLIVSGGPASDFRKAVEMGADGAFRDAWEAAKEVKKMLKEKKLV